MFGFGKSGGGAGGHLQDAERQAAAGESPALDGQAVAERRITAGRQRHQAEREAGSQVEGQNQNGKHRKVGHIFGQQDAPAWQGEQVVAGEAAGGIQAEQALCVGAESQGHQRCHAGAATGQCPRVRRDADYGQQERQPGIEHRQHLAEVLAHEFADSRDAAQRVPSAGSEAVGEQRNHYQAEGGGTAGSAPDEQHGQPHHGAEPQSGGAQA